MEWGHSSSIFEDWSANQRVKCMHGDRAEDQRINTLSVQLRLSEMREKNSFSQEQFVLLGFCDASVSGTKATRENYYYSAALKMK